MICFNRYQSQEEMQYGYKAEGFGVGDLKAALHVTHTILVAAVTIPMGRHSSREGARAPKLRRMGFSSQSSGQGDRRPSVIHWRHRAILLDDTVPLLAVVLGSRAANNADWQSSEFATGGQTHRHGSYTHLSAFQLPPFARPLQVSPTLLGDCL